jgi:glycosyltransferase involved in cell wall biosynthesis
LKIFLNVTQTYESRGSSGIPRVVRRLSDELSSVAANQEIVLTITHRIYPQSMRRLFVEDMEQRGDLKLGVAGNIVKMGSEGLRKIEASKIGFLLRNRVATRAISTIGNLISIFLPVWKPSKVELAIPSQGDVVLFLDAFWADSRGIRLAKRIVRKGVRIAVLLNDVIPYSHPQFVQAQNLQNFRKFVPKMLAMADLIMYPTETTKIQTNNYLGRLIESKPQWVIPYGSDFRSPTQEVQSTQLGGKHRIKGSVCALGTIEPRKNYEALLRWFLEDSESQQKLTIIGKPGWHTADLQKHMRQLMEVDRNFTWLEDADDNLVAAELDKHDIGVFPSFAEGYGLPIVEMSQKGLKLVLSDIPVFREVAGDAAEFFDPQSPASLSKAISRAAENSAVKNLETDTWSSSASRVLEILLKLDAS